MYNNDDYYDGMSYHFRLVFFFRGNSRERVDHSTFLRNSRRSTINRSITRFSNFHSCFLWLPLYFPILLSSTNYLMQSFLNFFTVKLTAGTSILLSNCLTFFCLCIYACLFKCPSLWSRPVVKNSLSSMLYTHMIKNYEKSLNNAHMLFFFALIFWSESF